MKKIVTLAVLGAILAPAAHADTVNVNVYGRLRVGVESINEAASTAATDSKQIRVVDNSSVLGFKGTEDLADGWQVNWQAELGIESDGDDAVVRACQAQDDCSKTKDYRDFKLASRNTFVALKSDFGTLLLGKNDTPYKVAARYLRDTSLNDTTGEINAIWGKGLASPSGSLQNFYTRQASTIQYLSPKLAGFDFKIGYAPDEAKKSSSNRANLSLSAGFENDLFYVSSAYEHRADADSTKTRPAKAGQVTAGVKLGKNGHVTVGFERFSLAGVDQNNAYLAAKYKITETISVSGQYAQAGEAGDVADSGASLFGLGAQYDFSKRTNVAVYYAQLRNDSAAWYKLADNAIDKVTAAGKDPRVIGAGLNILF